MFLFAACWEQAIIAQVFVFWLWTLPTVANKHIVKGSWVITFRKVMFAFCRTTIECSCIHSDKAGVLRTFLNHHLLPYNLTATLDMLFRSSPLKSTQLIKAWHSTNYWSCNNFGIDCLEILHQDYIKKEWWADNIPPMCESSVRIVWYKPWRLLGPASYITSKSWK